MAKGIVRKLDELGRVVIPKEYRKSFGTTDRDPLGMLVENGVIHLVKAGPKFIGMVRNLDELGRYTLPIETRRVLGLEIGQKVDIYVDEFNDAICISKEGCHFCSGTEDLKEFKGTYICGDCLEEISSLQRGGHE